MNRIAIFWKHSLGLLALLLLVLSAIPLHAQKKTNPPPPPPKAAPPPPQRSAPAAQSAYRPSSGGGSNNVSTPRPGPSIGGGNNTSRTGPTIGGGNTSAPRTGPTIGGGNTSAPRTGPTIGGGGNTTAPRPGTTISGGNPMGPRGGSSGSSSANISHDRNTARALPSNSREVPLKNGNRVVMRHDGRPRDVVDTRRGINIHNGLDGSRHVSVLRADHSRIYAERGRPGYIDRGYNFHGRAFERRAYFYHGRSYDRFYRGYDGFRPGLHLAIYAPYHYYGVGFYGWAYNPWFHPIVYPWGWAGNPWYGYYGYYFSPYAAYPSASYWLTDYIISQDLAAEYQAQQEAQLLDTGAPDGAAQLTPEVKQMIADEVRGQLALENAEAQQTAAGQDVDPAFTSIAHLLSDGQPHVFVVGDSLDLVDAAGNECAVSDGDALELNSAPPADSQAAQLTVLSSKGRQECRRMDVVNVALTDLQEMQNHMRERIDQGLDELKAKQGQSGLPAAPPSALGAPVESAYAQQAPPPEANGAADINQQLSASDQSQQEVVAQAQQEGGPNASFQNPPPPAAPAGPPPTVALGQTIDQVTSAFGQPATVIDLGAKKVYNYPGMKVTFRNGKVSDVQ
jgi:hypothetical protein